MWTALEYDIERSDFLCMFSGDRMRDWSKLVGFPPGEGRYLEEIGFDTQVIEELHKNAEIARLSLSGTSSYQEITRVNNVDLHLFKNVYYVGLAEDTNRFRYLLMVEDQTEYAKLQEDLSEKERHIEQINNLFTVFQCFFEQSRVMMGT